MFHKVLQSSKACRLIEECCTFPPKAHFREINTGTASNNNCFKTKRYSRKMPISSSSHAQRELSHSTFPITHTNGERSSPLKANNYLTPRHINFHQLVEEKDSPSPVWLPRNRSDSLQKKLEPDYGEKLYLTPYIKSCKIKEAQALSKVGNLVNPICDRKLSEFGYSGYLTVNEQHNSNLFFWFFPAKVNPETAPVLLWINGGPGASSMFGLFAANGPFFVDTIGELQPRKISWTENHSVVYIDSPVGTGFSFTESDAGYCRTLDEVMKDLYEGLHQFFLLFPEYQARDFYITGQSYTGKYAPALAHKIHYENKNNALTNRVKINLKGLAVGSGLCDPLTQTDYGEFLFNVGLIDLDEKTYFDNSYKEVCNFIAEKRWTDAHKILQHLIIGWPRPIVAHFEKLTGYSFNSNYLYQDMPARYGYYMQFLKNDYVRRNIHVGTQEFGSMKNLVYMYLSDDFPQSVKPFIEELLDLDYKIMFYASQFDIIVPHTGITRFINSLKWNGCDKYKKSQRKIWLVNNEIGGYVKEAKNLIHVLLRNSGHLACHDQPESCFDMITRFTRAIPF